MKGFIDQDDFKKIWRLADGSLFGMAGDYNRGLFLYQLLVTQAKHKKKSGKATNLPKASLKGVAALLVSPTKTLWYYSDGMWEKLDREYAAVGSGFEVATVAMDFGATAKEAVQAACRRISTCGGKIRTLEV